ncbi:MAG: NAD(P)-dependent oxidoreductase [Nocardioidaceae bacterium]|nr:NAD(P)-dependent oxidoreductase [Nocardioidaceae bacterium]
MTEGARASVGVVGLGAMGRPAAEFLAASEFDTFVYDLDAAALEAIAEKGATPTSSLKELAEGSTVIFVFVPSDDDVRTVCLGEDGLLAGAQTGSVLAICSSALPETCEAVAAQGAERAVDVLDAALTGGVRGAEAGEINLLVGGDESVLDRIRPTLDPWCGSVHHMGALGTGQVGKTVNNLVHWAQISAIHEALQFGQRLGVAPTKLREALKDGPTDSRTLREIEQMRFTWHKKDLANAFAMAQTVEPPIELPVAETAREAMLSITVDSVAALLADRQPDPDPARA